MAGFGGTSFEIGVTGLPHNSIGLCLIVGRVMGCCPSIPLGTSQSTYLINNAGLITGQLHEDAISNNAF